MFFFFLLLLFSIFTRSVLAKNDFIVNQNITYQLDINGNAQVTQEIELVNNLSQVYPKEYQIIISSEKIENIFAADNLGNIITDIKKENEQTIINIKFNEQKVGKNQKTNFKLNYQIFKLAERRGNIWEISLPENKNNLTDQTIKTNIFVPFIFGSLSFSSLQPQKVISLNNQTEVYFNSFDSQSQKIYLIFGNYQLFDFKFKYFLENTSALKNIFTIALPPETDSQKIIYRSIEPNPENIIIDSDGNYLATYQLSPSQKINIDIDGQAKIIHSNLNKATINPKNYLKSDMYWETNQPELILIAQNLSTPKDIYNYVINTLNYKQQNIDNSVRQGALKSISNPNNALCTEFTDLFITLSRIKGIPAREVQGFAYSNNIKIKPININTDILHAWPQYYDQQRQSWVSVDPTWGKTTNGIDFFSDLDPNHFAFVFHGLSSTYPLPPGAYKNNHDAKTVTVEFAKNELNKNQLPLKITPVTSKIYQPPLVKIQNPNYQSISNLKIIIQKFGIETIIDHLPPLSSIEIPIQNKLKIKSFLPTNFKINIKLEYDSDSVDFQINNSFYWFKFIIFISTFVTLIGFGGIITKRIKK